MSDGEVERINKSISIPVFVLSIVLAVLLTAIVTVVIMYVVIQRNDASICGAEVATQKSFDSNDIEIKSTNTPRPSALVQVIPKATPKTWIKAEDYQARLESSLEHESEAYKEYLAEMKKHNDEALAAMGKTPYHVD